MSYPRTPRGATSAQVRPRPACRIYKRALPGCSSLSGAPHRATTVQTATLTQERPPAWWHRNRARTLHCRRPGLDACFDQQSHASSARSSMHCRLSTPLWQGPQERNERSAQGLQHPLAVSGFEWTCSRTTPHFCGRKGAPEWGMVQRLTGHGGAAELCVSQLVGVQGGHDRAAQPEERELRDLGEVNWKVTSALVVRSDGRSQG